eukprot:TRINITY_DN976_c1_g1_i4.p1 TRINITY_DN976_c1_g1~~TRINITY_DN976_c1_g1_i4.p1  ORF type:complete len:598 (+),score=100.31 TRINITY_DN976_c1_g1_i4:184-1977(+)
MEMMDTKQNSENSLQLQITEDERSEVNCSEYRSQNNTEINCSEYNCQNNIEIETKQGVTSQVEQDDSKVNNGNLNDSEVNDFAIAWAIQEQENEHAWKKSQRNRPKRRKKRNGYCEENDIDYVCDQRDCEDDSDSSSVSDKQDSQEGYIVDEDFAGQLDFEIYANLFEDTPRLMEDGMVIDTDSELEEEGSDMYLQQSSQINDNNGRIKRRKTNNHNIVRTPKDLGDPAFQVPYFLFEQVASCFGDAQDIFVEFLNSKLVRIDSYPIFSRAMRKRVYATNIRNHISMEEWVVPKRTLQELFNWPQEKPFPVWTQNLFKIDPLRTILACSSMQVSRAWLEDAIRILDMTSVTCSEGDIKGFFQEDILEKLKKMNLVPNIQKTLVELTPEQKEELMGYPVGHTRMREVERQLMMAIRDPKSQQQLNYACQTEQKYLNTRNAGIGNAFQVDTIAYLLSPLEKLQKEGKIGKINVLSLFDGIGGAAVALHKLGIQVRKYYSSEINPYVKEISRMFVVSNLKCEFVDLMDVQKVNNQEFLNTLVGEEKIDLVIGGPPCQNLSGANRHRGEIGRSGITGPQSRLFFDFAEIIDRLNILYSKLE